MLVFIETVIWLILALSTGLSLWAFFSAIVTPSIRFSRANTNKALWILLVFFFGVFAAVPYLLIVRPKLTVL